MVDGRIVFGETHLFVGRGYRGVGPAWRLDLLRRVRERCESMPDPLTHGEDYILYAILDFVVDNYMPVLEAIHCEVEEIEDRVLATTLTQPEIERLYQLRRDLLRLRSRGAPRRGLPPARSCRARGIDHSMQPLFRDVTDHVRSVQEEIDVAARGPGLRVRGEPDDGPGQQTRSPGSSPPGRPSWRCRPPSPASTA